jgi:dTDP-glucose 4,6-dehydratase
MKALVTGGCGFIGSALVRRLVRDGHDVLNLDKLTYAGDPRTVAEAAASPRYGFVKADICDADAVRSAFDSFQPDTVFHLAAESHVDRSIDGPAAFIETNVRGTFVLLEAASRYWSGLAGARSAGFRLVHVSTDEVYGSLGAEGRFTEDTPYAPNSPYSASKASADHLVRAWCKTYGLPAIVSNCSNNYGPFQNREKLIPTIIRKALNGQPIPIYGRGENVRDWLFVDDHVAALLAIAGRGRPGEKYNVGGRSEVKNIEIARSLCALLDQARPLPDAASYGRLITFVTDRPGHDFRYAIDARRIEAELGWRPQETFATGLARTVAWFLARPDWSLAEGDQSDRLGLGAGRAA